LSTKISGKRKRDRIRQSNPDMASTRKTADTDEIDEGLYSRQLYVIGHEAMKKMGTANILLVGLKGLGVELAKNLILTGVKSVTIHDDEPTSLFDLAAQFYLSEKDIGKPRAASCVARLSELNSYVQVNVHSGDLNEDVLKHFKVVVMADQPLELMRKVNAFTHANKIAFISVEGHGVFANIFCDFGDEFVVQDTNGEPPSSLMVASISQENPGIVTVTDDHRIPFEDGEFVTFTEVQGMTELNNSPPRKIKIISPFTFSIEDTTPYNPYKSGGYVTQVKQPAVLKFLSLEESIKRPEHLLSDFAKMDRPDQLHLAFQAIHAFRQKHRKWPTPRDEAHANEVLAFANEINAGQVNKQEKLDEKLIKLVSHNAMGELAAMTTYLGGVAAQEVLKSVTGKYTPIKQWFYFDATEILPSGDLDPKEFQPIGSRYDAQITVLGKTLHDKITQLTYFLVGSGAIGCEVLKVWAMMGLGTKGMIHITDMDTIEKSNLSRQFLFRSADVEKLKSETAARAVRVMNPETRVTAYSNRVGPETESVFNEKFYSSLSGVCNALDNVEARLYMDSQCVLYKKPLLESGTLGTKGNTQVIVPHLTESYASSRDPPEKSIPTCTLHHFPNAIEHTIQWARDVFEGLYRNQAEQVNSYVTNTAFMEQLAKQSGGVKLETLSNIKNCLVDDKPKGFEDCIKWARLKFEEYFNHNIQQLLHNFPADMVTITGAPFWSGPKRAPRPIGFQLDNQLHIDFIIATANLRAANFGIEGSRNPEVFKKVIPNIMVPEFVPKKVTISTNENEEANKNENRSEDDDEISAKLAAAIPGPHTLQGFKMVPLEFEKDNDANFHIDFVTATANLRAFNYSIPLADRHKCKGIAGKIIPAMVTTTAVVSGLVCIELIKLFQEGKKIEDFKNGFVNLALPFFGFSEPIAPQKTKIRESWSWTLWDRFDIQGTMTLQQFLDYFKEKYQLEVTMLSCGVSMVYSFFLAKDKLNDRLPKKITDVIADITKQPIPETKSYLTMEVCCNRLEDDEEVDVPYIRYQFR